MVTEHFDSWVPRLFGAGATTLMPLGIFYRHSRADVERVEGGWSFIRRHEWQHVSQYRRMGFLRFYLTYLWQALTHGYLHDAIPMEQEALAHQMETEPPANCPDMPRVGP